MHGFLPLRHAVGPNFRFDASPYRAKWISLETGLEKVFADGLLFSQMADLKENIEAEISAAKAEYQKMAAHIELYVTEMEQAI